MIIHCSSNRKLTQFIRRIVKKKKKKKTKDNNNKKKTTSKKLNLAYGKRNLSERYYYMSRIPRTEMQLNLRNVQMRDTTVTRILGL